LNLYGRDAATLASLSAAVWAAYDPHGPGPSAEGHGLDPGGEALVAGLAGAFGVRACIQQAIGAIMAATHRTADTAYLFLRLRAAARGATLTDTATTLLTEPQW
jgi:hypothetical protein